MSQKSESNGCGLACILVFLLPFGALYLLFGVAWPIGTALNLGEWVLGEPGEGYYQFYFDDDFRWVGWAVSVFFAAQAFALVKVWSRLFRDPPAANPKYREFPQSGRTAGLWEHRLGQDHSALMCDYTSRLESRLRWQQLPFWVGGCLMFLSPVLAASTARILDSFKGDDPTDVGGILLIGLYLTGLCLLVVGALVKKAQPFVDDRLIVDFERSEVQKIALHDPFCEPERWFGFDDIKHLLYTKGLRTSGNLCDGSLEVVAEDGRFSLFSQSLGDWEALANRLAKKFSTRLEIVEVTRFKK